MNNPGQSKLPTFAIYPTVLIHAHTLEEADKKFGIAADQIGDFPGMSVTGWTSMSAPEDERS